MTKQEKANKIAKQLKTASPMKFIRLQSEYCNLLYQIEAEKRREKGDWKKHKFKNYEKATLHKNTVRPCNM